MSGAGAATATIPRAADAARRRRAFGRLATRNRLAVVAALALVGAVLGALLAPWLPLSGPDVVDSPNRLRPPLSAVHALRSREIDVVWLVSLAECRSVML